MQSFNVWQIASQLGYKQKIKSERHGCLGIVDNYFDNEKNERKMKDQGKMSTG